MTVKVLHPAMRDLAEARRFYERQQRGLGTVFFSSIFSDIDSLQQNAGIHRVIFGFHRLLAGRFPYAIYYRLEDETALVFRVLDCRRDPNKVPRALT